MKDYLVHPKTPSPRTTQFVGCHLTDRALLQNLLEKETQEHYRIDIFSSHTLIPDEDNRTSSSTNLHPLIYKEKIVSWMFKVVDHFAFDRQVVVYALNYIERMLLKHPKLLQTARSYSLLAMTSLWISIKVLHSCVTINCNFVPLDHFVLMSGSKLSSQDVESMEKIIFQDLQWRIYPPTPFQVITCFTLPSKRVYETVCFLTELFAFAKNAATSTTTNEISYLPHIVGYASIVAALELHDMGDNCVEIEGICRDIHEYSQVKRCQALLADLYHDQTANKTADTTVTTSEATKQEHPRTPNSIVSDAATAPVLTRSASVTPLQSPRPQRRFKSE